MRLFILLSYNGTAYSGWQRQNNAPSVQAELERAFSVYFRNKTEITGAGRTDAGVHAVNYVAHLDTDYVNPLKDRQKLIYKINAILPNDITIHDICHVDEAAHARFSALSRTYKYFIHTKKDPFLASFSYYYPYDLNIEAMGVAACHLVGEQDFTSMAKLHSDTNNNICNVTRAEWSLNAPVSIVDSRHILGERFRICSTEKNLHITEKNCGVEERCDNSTDSYTFCFTITANRFLRNMVRAVVGTLLEVGRGTYTPDTVIEILNKHNRGAAGNSVPPHSLFLTDIEYPHQLFKEKTQ